MARASITDPYQTHRFQLRVIPPLDIGAIGRFVGTIERFFAKASRVTVPSSSIEIEQIEEGNKMRPTKIATGITHGSITIEEGVFLQPSSFADWVRDYDRQDRPIKRNLLLQSQHRAQLLEGPVPELNLGGMKIWVMEDCLISDYKGHSDLDADSADVAFEEIEIEPEEVKFFDGGRALGALDELGGFA